MTLHDRTALTIAGVLCALAACCLPRDARAQESEYSLTDAAPAEAEVPRLRLGFNLNAGVGAGQNIFGSTFGGTFRAGWQLDRLSAVYGQVSGYFWLPSESGNRSSTFAEGAQLTPMYAVTPNDVIELAAGPSLDFIFAERSINGFTGRKLGLHSRFAIHIGGRDTQTGRRSGFTLSSDLHPTFVEGGWYTFLTFGLGCDWY